MRSLHSVLIAQETDPSHRSRKRYLTRDPDPSLPFEEGKPEVSEVIHPDPGVTGQAPGQGAGGSTPRRPQAVSYSFRLSQRSDRSPNFGFSY